MTPFRLLATLATLTLLAGCGSAPTASGDHPSCVVLPQMPEVAPEWATKGVGTCLRRSGAGVVVVMKATGALVDQPDVLLNEMDLEGRTQLASCIKTTAGVEAKGIQSRKVETHESTDSRGAGASAGAATGTPGGAASTRVSRQELKKAFERVAWERTELTLYGAHRGELYENCTGKVWALWLIPPDGLKKAFVGAGLTDAVADEMLRRLDANLDPGR